MSYVYGRPYPRVDVAEAVRPRPLPRPRRRLHMVFQKLVLCNLSGKPATSQAASATERCIPIANSCAHTISMVSTADSQTLEMYRGCAVPGDKCNRLLHTGHIPIPMLGMFLREEQHEAVVAQQAYSNKRSACLLTSLSCQSLPHRRHRSNRWFDAGGSHVCDPRVQVTEQCFQQQVALHERAKH